jgi:excisionase family DNA binding protein
MSAPGVPAQAMAARALLDAEPRDADLRESDTRAAIVILRPRVLRKLEAAKYLGVSRATVERMIAAGEIEAKTLRGVVLVSVASLDAYLDALPDAREGRRQ